jgi:hypothetical protein
MLRSAAAISVCVLLAMTATASAQQKKKKVSHAEAWRICKAMLDKEGAANPLNTNERYLRGGACLAKFGYSF